MTQVIIRCDGCVSGSIITRGADGFTARVLAARSGWKHDQGSGFDYCPTCVRNETRRQQLGRLIDREKGAAAR